ncbi:MAG: hypothetical protein KDK97_03315 [Verrucomicrobiales bacterium]|nr:hypothetical protein [Verrucomicrobiales bacterium]MCP5560485.1 hypothetical protein [Verrucomicrobiaceae bacterium]
MKTLLSVLVFSFGIAASVMAGMPVNAECPISGKPIRLIFRSKYKDQVIAFCCADCKDKFDKSPSSYASHVKVAAKQP